MKLLIEWYHILERFVAIAIPIASFSALGYSMYLFAKTKGQKDAMQSTIDTYKGLADARKDQIEELEYQRQELEHEVRDLRSGIAMQKEVMCSAIDELVAGFNRAGANMKKPSVDFCEEGES